MQKATPLYSKILPRRLKQEAASVYEVRLVTLSSALQGLTTQTTASLVCGNNSSSLLNRQQRLTPPYMRSAIHCLGFKPRHILFTPVGSLADRTGSA
jgi:hypothetical protein